MAFFMEQKMSVFVAFYKGKPRNIGEIKEHIYDYGIRLVTFGQYSHCEIAVYKDVLFDCYSSSPRDGGVRMKNMALPSDRWDLIPVNLTEQQVIDFFNQNKGKKYDWQAISVFLIPVINKLQSKNKWFCSEYCAENLGLKNSYRFSPNSLAKYLMKNGG